MKVALTGHRPQRLGLPEDELDDKWEKIRDWIVHNLTQMIQTTTLENDQLEIYCGMASGSDILFGMTSAFLKAGNVIPLKIHCILPCKNYNSLHKYYKDIKILADECIELSDEFYKGCDSVRDQYMVDHCDVLLAIWDGNKSGGVWSTIRKAQKAGKQIIYCPKEVLGDKHE